MTNHKLLQIFEDQKVMREHNYVNSRFKSNYCPIIRTLIINEKEENLLRFLFNRTFTYFRHSITLIPDLEAELGLLN